MRNFVRRGVGTYNFLSHSCHTVPCWATSITPNNYSIGFNLYQHHNVRIVVARNYVVWTITMRQSQTPKITQKSGMESLFIWLFDQTLSWFSVSHKTNSTKGNNCHGIPVHSSFDYLTRHLADLVYGSYRTISTQGYNCHGIPVHFTIWPDS